MKRSIAFPVDWMNVTRWKGMTLRELEDLQLKLIQKLDKLDGRRTSGIREQYLDLLEQLDITIDEKQKQTEKDEQNSPDNSR